MLSTDDEATILRNGGVKDETWGFYLFGDAMLWPSELCGRAPGKWFAWAEGNGPRGDGKSLDQAMSLILNKKRTGQVGRVYFYAYRTYDQGRLLAGCEFEWGDGSTTSPHCLLRILTGRDWGHGGVEMCNAVVMGASPLVLLDWVLDNLDAAPNDDIDYGALATDAIRQAMCERWPDGKPCEPTPERVTASMELERLGRCEYLRAVVAYSNRREPCIDVKLPKWWFTSAGFASPERALNYVEDSVGMKAPSTRKRTWRHEMMELFSDVWHAPRKFSGRGEEAAKQAAARMAGWMCGGWRMTEW